MIPNPQDMTVAEILAATREAMAETIALLKQAREQLEAL